MPCRNCPNRHENCHADCPDYAEFRKQVEADNEARRKAVQNELYGRSLVRNGRRNHR